MKALFVCAFPPSKSALQAGHRLAFEYIIEIAASSNVDIVLLLRKGQVINPDLYNIPNTNVIKVIYFSKWNMLLNFIKNRSISSFFTRYSKKVEEYLLKITKENKYETVRLEFSQVFFYGIALRNEFKDSIKIHVANYDIQLQLSLRRKAGIKSIFIKSVYDLEEQTFKLADKVFAISKKDTTFINIVYGQNIVTEALKLPLPDFVYHIKRNIDTIEKGSLLFWGAMNRSENEDSIVYFIENVFNTLSTKLNAKLYIVGANPTKNLLSYASEKIIVTGFVDDPSEYFEKAQVGIVPLLFGAGLKLKTMEMLEAGLPVVSTFMGAEGIQAQEKDSLYITGIDDFKNILEKMLL